MNREKKHKTTTLHSYSYKIKLTTIRDLIETTNRNEEEQEKN